MKLCLFKIHKFPNSLLVCVCFHFLRNISTPTTTATNWFNGLCIGSLDVCQYILRLEFRMNVIVEFCRQKKRSVKRTNTQTKGYYQTTGIFLSHKTCLANAIRISRDPYLAHRHIALDYLREKKK